jgi:hypothetical protein
MRFSSRLALVLSLLALAATGQAAEPMQLLVPAYFYPAGNGAKTWSMLTDAAKRADMIAILNPNSGPGAKADPTYVRIVNDFRAAGGTLYGYVTSSYGKRSPDEVMAEVAKYQQYYKIDGLFLDEMDNTPKNLDSYREIARRLHEAIPGGKVIGNPGTSVPEAYVRDGAADVLVTFENDFKLDTESAPPAWASAYPSGRFARIVHTVPDASAFHAVLDRTKTRNFGYVFITDALMPNPYDRLPSWWNELVDATAKRSK